MQGRLINMNVTLGPNGGKGQRIQDEALGRPGFKF